MSKLAGVFCLPILYGVLTIKLVPQLTVTSLLLLLVCFITYPVAQFRRKKSWKAALKGLVAAIVVGILALVLFRSVVFEPRYLVGTAMMPTIENGTRLVGDKTSYWFRSPQRGDVILFQSFRDDGPSVAQISRIIGLPGDTVEIKSGQVWINQVFLNEPYRPELTTETISFDPFQVKKNHYFVLSDNRNEVWSYPDAQLFFSQVPRGTVTAKLKSRMLSWQPLYQD